MPRRAKWRRDGTSASPKMIDLRLPRLGRLQAPSGVVHRAAYELRVGMIRECWALGGVWGDAVKALRARRIDVHQLYTAKQQGEPAVRALLAEAGAEPVSTLIRDYLKQTRAVDTGKMRQRLTRFAASLGKAPTSAAVTTASVEAFLSGLIDQRTTKTGKVPAKGSTINRYRAVIGGFCTWAVKVGRMPSHPIAGKRVEKRPEPHHRLPEMTAEEYRGYVACASGLRPDLVVVLLLLLHTAPDVGELLSRETRDVDLTAKRITYRRTKTQRHATANRPRVVPLPTLVVDELRLHLAEWHLDGAEPLFGMVKRSDIEWLHDRAAEAIQRPMLTLKDLRHIAAIAWVKAGLHIRLVQKYLGHASLSQTMKYCDYEPDAAAMNEMADRAAATLTTPTPLTSCS